MFTGMKLTWFFIPWMLVRSWPARKVFSVWRGSLPTTVVCWFVVVTFKTTKYSLSIHIITNSQMVGYNATIMLQLHLVMTMKISCNVYIQYGWDNTSFQGNVAHDKGKKKKCQHHILNGDIWCYFNILLFLYAFFPSWSLWW